VAAGLTYEPIATISTTSSSHTFNSIPGTYTDLLLVINSKNQSTSNLRLRFNSDTGTNYSDTLLFGFGSSFYSTRDISQSFIYIGTSYDGWGVQKISIQNYSNSGIYKAVLGRSDQASNAVAAIVGLWRNTNAITSLTVDNAQGFSFSSGTTLTLYGIAAA
jgi:hypothetical protein